MFGYPLPRILKPPLMMNFPLVVYCNILEIFVIRVWVGGYI